MRKGKQFSFFFNFFTMSLLDELRKILGRKKQPTLRGIIRQQTGCSSRNIYVQDRYIDLISDEEMDEFLAADKSHEIQWQPEICDCDDISRIFWNNAKLWFYSKKNKNASVGWIWAGAHAFNFFVRNDLKVVFIEPSLHKRVPLTSRPRLIVV